MTLTESFAAGETGAERLLQYGAGAFDNNEKNRGQSGRTVP